MIVRLSPFRNYKNSTVVEGAISSDLAQLLDAVLSELTPREREIVKLRFGIGTSQDHTLGEIGKRYNLSRERVRQILEAGLKKLRTSGNMIELKDFVNFT